MVSLSGLRVSLPRKEAVALFSFVPFGFAPVSCEVASPELSTLVAKSLPGEVPGAPAQSGV